MFVSLIRIFFLSCLRPLLWPYPFIPLVNKTGKDFADSPVPILASHLEESGRSFADRWQHADDNRIHINVDDSEAVGSMLEVYLSKLFEAEHLLPQLQSIQSKYKSSQQQKGDPAASKLAFLLSLQAVQVIRSLISRIYIDGFDEGSAREHKDIDLIKAVIIKKSKLNDCLHKRLLDSQLFSYSFERLLAN